MPESTARDGPADLRAALAGVRALLLDLDGVIILRGRAIAGAAGAVAELDRRAVPYRIVTNTSLISRAGLERESRRIGVPIPRERFMSALSATAAWTASMYPERPLYVLTSDDGRTEFDGQHLLSHDAADAHDAEAAAVVIGDSPDEITYDNLNRAFRLVRRGARLVGMHRNAWWLTPDGPTLDAGGFVVALEYATGTRATILGKPAREFFVEGVRELAGEVRAEGGPRLVRRQVAMVGDDVRTDVLAGRRAGLRGIFVRTGKHGNADLAEAARDRRGGRPDAIAASLAEVVAALD
jgi:HAD superfamily hydrolase (TIGR01458 family)